MDSSLANDRKRRHESIGDHDQSTTVDSEFHAPETTHECPMLSSFERLPLDTAALIFDRVPAALHALRLTSRSLRTRVDEHALRKQTIQLVDQLTVHASPITLLSNVANASKETVITVASHIIKVTIIVRQIDAALFELRLKLRRHQSALLRGMKRQHRTDASYEYNMESALSVGYLATSLCEAMGGRIGTVRISGCPDDAIFGAVFKLLNQTRVESLQIRVDPLSDGIMKNAMHLIDLQKVNKLSLSVGKMTISDPVSALLNVSSLVQALRIKQEAGRKDDGSHRSENYLFGISNAYWAAIIIDIFSRKVDKLKIDNPEYPGYLPVRCVDRIRDHLPVMGKKIWFEASCERGNHLDTSIGEHSIRVKIDRVPVRSDSGFVSRFGPAFKTFKRLTIKHSSRQHEMF